MEMVLKRKKATDGGQDFFIIVKCDGEVVIPLKSMSILRATEAADKVYEALQKAYGTEFNYDMEI